MFKWKKLGKVFDPTVINHKVWMSEYSLAPSTVVLEDRVRVFFSCRPPRDENRMQVSYSSYIDLDKNDLFKVIYISENPVIELGSLGAFDEFGVVVTSVLRKKNNVFAYYIGWSRMSSVPYATAIGVLESSDFGKTFKRIGMGGPIISANLNEPFREQASPIVRIFNDVWHMWYMTGLKWVKHENKIEPIYQIVHAISEDGINWQREGIPIIKEKYKDECQTTPNVFYYNGKYHMFFSYRQPVDFRNNIDRSYRIGYAYSYDLKNWDRDDGRVGITISDEGWDSQMICYPHVFELNKKMYMFYCGNTFGREGFGVAELEEYIDF